MSRSGSTIERFFASSGVGCANRFSAATVGVAACTACLPVTEAWPSDLIAGVAERENGGRFVSSRSTSPEAWLRFESTGS